MKITFGNLVVLVSFIIINLAFGFKVQQVCFTRQSTTKFLSDEASKDKLEVSVNLDASNSQAQAVTPDTPATPPSPLSLSSIGDNFVKSLTFGLYAYIAYLFAG